MFRLTPYAPTMTAKYMGEQSQRHVSAFHTLPELDFDHFLVVQSVAKGDENAVFLSAGPQIRSGFDFGPVCVSLGLGATV